MRCGRDAHEAKRSVPAGLKGFKAMSALEVKRLLSALWHFLLFAESLTNTFLEYLVNFQVPLFGLVGPFGLS